MGEKEVAAIGRLIKAMGEDLRRFKQTFAANVGLKRAVIVNSGSFANTVGMAALFDVALGIP